MKLLTIILKACASLVLLSTLSSAQASLIIGQNDNGNCFPFSCLASTQGTHYQQIYAANSFSQPQKISSISFFSWREGPIDTASYSISFYLSSRAVNNLSLNPMNNKGSLLAEFGLFNLTGSMPAQLLFDGTDFIYNPALGNLLMDVKVSNVTKTVGQVSYFQADYSGLHTQRFYSNDYVGSSVGPGALVTEFGFSALNTVSAPASLSCLLIGLIAIARRQHVKRQLKKAV